MKLTVQDLNSHYGPAHILFDIALEVVPELLHGPEFVAARIFVFDEDGCSLSEQEYKIRSVKNPGFQDEALRKHQPLFEHMALYTITQ